MSGGQLLENFVTYLINPAILVIFTAGFFLFTWGLVRFLLDLDKGANREQHIQHMVWGVVGMFVMASVYGILALLDNTFDLNAFSGTPDTSRWQDINIPRFF
ncbi:hypothetical protein A2853_00950 [Candidatus Kaiserbacteria bacterium RIFCSPHIGHO2_01_FULL_55_17]|uniref:Uncharacterized protein n=1 Tax=Candidatus Kaiserbacteria bacterium RIFCSPHIGHO2_01_FULL_55_17 TaxID=1798484 RepID=A0A1F6D9F9_9BACT|nr:MAG: hypothetical protein A2853_00950 [Candidatus Kaiserbacteria bacterium RIFCSPHIGHO2_01_FULL_55_17]